MTSPAFNWWRAAGTDHLKLSYLHTGSLALSQSDHWVICHGSYQNPAPQIAVWLDVQQKSPVCSKLLPFQNKGGHCALVTPLDMYVSRVLFQSFGKGNSLDLNACSSLSDMHCQQETFYRKVHVFPYHVS